MTRPGNMSNRNLSRNPMAPLLERALCALFSLSNKQVISSPLEEPEAVRKSAALLCLDGSAESLNGLSDAGFRKIRRFAVLPSLTEPRWLLPEDNSRQAVGGLELYTPFSIRTRILKALGQGIALAGFPGRSNSRVLVASREPLPIENLVKGLLQESHPGFAISLGTPATCQKLTVQAMSPAGEILAYIKIPLGPAAQARVKSETEILEKLSQFPRIRSRIPRLLSCADLGNGKILVQTPLSGNPGPTGLTRYSRASLMTTGSTLPARHFAWRPGSLMGAKSCARHGTETLLPGTLASTRGSSPALTGSRPVGGRRWIGTSSISWRKRNR